ncbi:hypothetical protein ACM2W4_16370 (plasmid) [Enterococcus casseliflavus]|uniref:hypothetical protein n=1 Tax=Enterococcus casseliflavus TaxID=37734 RepID=UPI001CE0E0E8|nr:hypothetical protein [Enterococcus casseliflavus]MDU5815010.1 hypothetical protein [Enterococcus casseliflavus]MEB6088102.1 hypothetical protein [Enterococcus casseliflavus]
MVYTKAYKMHNIRKLKQSKEYIKNASKTTVNLEGSDDHLDHLPTSPAKGLSNDF